MDFKKPRNATKSKFEDVNMDDSGNEAVVIVDKEEVKLDSEAQINAIAGTSSSLNGTQVTGMANTSQQIISGIQSK